MFGTVFVIKHTVVLNEAAKERGILARRLYLVDSVCEIGNAAARTVESPSNPTKGAIVEQPVKIFLEGAHYGGVANENLSKGVDTPGSLLET